MIFSQGLYARDEELGKKDDDHRPGQKGRVRFRRLKPKMHALQKRSVRRLALGAFFLFILYCFIQFGGTVLETPIFGFTHNSRIDIHLRNNNEAPVITEPIYDEPEQSAINFDGPIKFHHLTSALIAISDSTEDTETSRNVLFAAANLKSAAAIIPEACEMARRKQNDVHFAIMGRNDLAIDLLKSINGVGTKCKITFYDARPDFSTSSSESRMKKSVSSAFKEINKHLKPEATLVDASETEETWFLDEIKSTALDLGRTIIELPKKFEENLRWISLLDSKSLSAWNKFSLEIVIHPQPSATGSLVRLLESLRKADYFSSRPPHLTIELPHKIEEHTSRYLTEFKWPTKKGQRNINQLTLHHRIPQHGLTPEENSIRLLESFWPIDPLNSQVLILSTQAEVSPLFFHYLKYSVLNFKYGNKFSRMQNSLLGISLDTPSLYLNGTTPFVTPSLDEKEFLPFLWQAPNSNACIFFAEKWIELHDFVARSLKSQHNLSASPPISDDNISKNFPSWLRYFHQLARLRGYLTLYPNFGNRNSIATIHNDLFQVPEEHKPQEYIIKNKEHPLTIDSLVGPTESQQKIIDFNDLSILSWDGEKQDLIQVDKHASDYKRIFKKEVGGCASEAGVETVDSSVGDLFCLGL